MGFVSSVEKENNGILDERVSIKAEGEEMQMAGWMENEETALAVTVYGSY